MMRYPVSNPIKYPTTNPAGVPSVGFSPLDIAGFEIWLRADLGTWQDSGKTTAAVSNADVIGAWADQSGNGRDALQGTTANKPTLRLGVLNSLPIIRFDGINDFLQAAYPDVAQPYVRFVVAKSDGFLSEHIINSVTGNTAVIWVDATFSLYAGAVLTSPTFDTDWHILTGVFNGLSSSIRIDGSVTSDDAGGDSIAGGITVGARNSGLVSWFDGDIAEVLDYSSITSDEIDQIEQYLADRYGITLA